jgi:hypothetical protein
MGQRICAEGRGKLSRESLIGTSQRIASRGWVSEGNRKGQDCCALAR